MRVLILDDEEARYLGIKRLYDKADEVYWASERRLFEEFLGLSTFDEMWLDHDLGLAAFNGVDAAQMVADLMEVKWPERVAVHSSNPIGANRMVQILKKAGISVVRIQVPEVK